jgi:hypothetical protein
VLSKMAGMNERDVDAAVAGVSRRQHGAFSRAQILRAGGGDGLIRSRVRTGVWVRLANGVYASADVQPTWHRQVMAATLVHGGLVAAAGPTAAVLHNADGFRRGRPRLLIPHSASGHNPLAQVRRTRHLTPIDVAHVGSIPTLTMERLVVDLAPDLDRHGLGRLIDRGVITNKLDPDKLLDRAGRLLRPGRPATIMVAGLMAERFTGTAPAASELEAGVYDLLDAAGFTGYVRQAMPPWFEPALGGVVMDTLFPDHRFILEGDGRLWHARLEQWERDLLRDAVALAHGYVTLRVTWRMLTKTPQRVVAAAAGWVRRAA